MRVSRAPSPRPATSQARRAKPSAARSRRIPSLFMGLQGQVCPETGLGTWKAHGFSGIFDARKNAKPPEVRCSIPIRMLPDSPDAATDHAEPRGGAVQGTRPPAFGTTITAKSGRQNSVIAALTFTGGFSAVRQRLREWRCDGADRSAPSPNRIDVRARFRPAHAAGLGAVDVQRPSRSP